MKFKFLIFAFCIIIVIIILITALLPLILSEPNLAVNFRFISLPLMIFMVLLLVCMGIFFLFNYRLLSLLEREDWPALAYYLEHKIFIKKRYSSRNVRLLASSYLVISDFHSILKLESKAQLIKPSVIGRSVLIFGAARILIGNHVEAAAFFKTHMEKVRRKDRQWTRWFHGFSLLLAGDFESTEPEFSSLTVSSNDAIISGLSSYFLHSSLEKYSSKPQECRDTAENGRQRVVKALKTADNWDKEIKKAGTDIHIAIIRKYIDEARQWLFTDE